LILVTNRQTHNGTKKPMSFNMPEFVFPGALLSCKLQMLSKINSHAKAKLASRPNTRQKPRENFALGFCLV